MTRSVVLAEIGLPFPAQRPPTATLVLVETA